MAPTDPYSNQDSGAEPTKTNGSGDGVNGIGNNGTAGSASSSSTSPPPASASVADNLSQALRDLARGEQTATALEASLTNLELKLDDILASFGLSDADLGELEEEVDGQDDDKKAATDKTAVDGERKNDGAGDAGQKK